MSVPEPAAWTFVAPASEPAVDPRGSEPRRLLYALRAGVGVRARFRLDWISGPDATVALATSDDLSRRWVERLLLPAYGHGRWRRAPPTSDAWHRNTDLRFGVVRGVAGGSLPHADPAPWADVVLSALPTLPAGLHAAWDFRGLGLGPWKTPNRRSAEPGVIPIGLRPRPLTLPERLERDRRETRRRSPVWEARLSIRSGRSAASRSARETLQSLIEAASTGDGDARLRFVAPARWLRVRPPALYLAEPEVAGILPGYTSRLVTPGGRATDSSSLLSMGFDSTGVPVGLVVEPGEGRHLAVVGETGMGKSTLLVRLAAAAASLGSVVLLDPIGDTGRRFLAALPLPLRERAVWISPTESPVAVDLLEPLRGGPEGAVASDRAVSALVDALRRVRAARYADSPFWGPRIEETLRMTLAAAAAMPGTTIADAERILAGSLGRAAPVAVEARVAFDALRAQVRDRPEEVEGSRRLLREITARPALVRMLSGARAPLHFADLSAADRIYVITGEASALGEAAARYLLAVYLALFWTERLSIPRPPKTFLVLDEAQWYAHESLSEMLRLGRRSNLHVWLATQALASLPEGVREAVGTNVADLVVFRGSPEEARELARMTPALTPDALWSLPRGSAAVLLGKGERVTFLEVGRLRARETGAKEALAAIAAGSRAYWADSDDGIVRESDEAAHATPRRSGIAPGTDDPARLVLLTLWAGLLDSPGIASVRVPLRDLRRVVDPSGVGVRAAGRSLAEAGILQASDRDASGTFWEVRRDGFAQLLGPGVDPAELDRAARRWSEVARGGAEPTQ